VDATLATTMRRHGLRAALVVLVLTGPVGWARAEAPAAPARPAAADKDKEAQRAARREERERLLNEVLDQMRAMRMWKLTEELKLDQATAAKVFPLLAQYDDKWRELARERGEVAREVKEQVRSGQTDNRRLQVLIDRLLANQVKRKTLEDERFKALRPSLTPLQQAKLLLLMPRLEDDFRQRIRQAMDEQRRQHGEDDPRDFADQPSPHKD
jgi:hypothetical protein